MKAIGIDIGTTGICGVLVDIQTGKVINLIAAPNDTFIATANPWEKIQDPERICTIAESILEKLLGDAVVAIGVTGQMHGILYTDAAGHAVSPLYTWQDMRGNLPYKDTTYAEYIGCAAGYGHTTHFYHTVNRLVPQTMRFLCTIGDYFGMKICNGKVPLMHSTNAASLGLFDRSRNVFRVDTACTVTDDFAVMGTYKNIPVSVAIGDNQAGFLGSGGTAESVLVNVGTGSQISVMADELENAVGTDLERRPYVGGKNLRVGAALCGGRAYAALKDFFENVGYMITGERHSDLYARMAQHLQDEGETDLICHTQFAGTRKNPTLRGSIQQLGTDNFTARDFMLAVLHGIADELYAMYSGSGLSAKKLIASGNAVRRNPVLQHIIGKTFNLTPHIPVCQEEAAYGAALFALVSAEYLQDIAQAAALVHYQV